MGLIGTIFGGAGATTALGDAVRGVAEVFTPNATRKMELAHDAYIAALSETGDEFKAVRDGFFDRFVNGLNRLPRPMLALGTLGLFCYAMADPVGFTQRMVGLGYVPEPLWWLLGAIVSFYFGAREAHYFRLNGQLAASAAAAAAAAQAARAPDEAAPATDGNPALEAWRASRGK